MCLQSTCSVLLAYRLLAVLGIHLHRAISAKVEERVQNMGDLRSWKVRRLVITAIDTPMRNRCQYFGHG